MQGRGFIVSKFLTQAEKFHKKAVAEFLAAKRNGMEATDLVQAAEKGWLAAHRATNALLDRFGKKVTAGTYRKVEDLTALERRVRDIKTENMVERFEAFHGTLHVAASYMEVVPAKIIERNLRAVGEYIEAVRRIISR